MKLLIVEDQSPPLRALEGAIKAILPKYCPGFSPQDYDVARCYSQAEGLISSHSYDLILLDHRMPCEATGNLEQEDFQAFCDKLENIGYGLIPLIKEKSPSAVIIGTSSLSAGEMRRFPLPEYQLDKVMAFQGLEPLLVKMGYTKKTI